MLRVTKLNILKIMFKQLLHRHRLKIGLVTSKSMFLVSFMIALLVLGVRQVGWFTPLELLAFDWMTRSRPEIGVDPRLLIVEITEADIQTQQHWPFSDQIISYLLETLSKQQPAVIGLDIPRPIPFEPGHEDLLTQLEKPNVMVITTLGSARITPTPPPSNVPPERVGFNDLVLDTDRVVRRNLMYAMNTNGEVLTSFSTNLAVYYLLHQHKVYMQNTSDNPEQIELGKAIFLPLKPNSGGYQNVDASGYQIMLNYRAGKKVAHTVTLQDVLNRKVPPEWVKNKIVLIGTTAASVKNTFPTPYSAVDDEKVHMSGVLIHAHIISQLLTAALGEPEITEVGIAPSLWSKKYYATLTFWPEKVEIIWILAWSLVGLLIAWKLQHPIGLIATTLTGIGTLFISSFILFMKGVWIPVAAPFVGFVITGSSIMLFKLMYNMFYDVLTHLPNRYLFIHRLQKRQYRKMHPNAVLVLHLDRFKVINMVLGHNKGDLLLIAFQTRLIKLLDRQVNYVHSIARVSEDEFAILLINFKRQNTIARLASNIQRKMQTSFNLKSDEVFTQINVGIAFESPIEQRDLLKDAQTAMYQARALENTKPAIFETAMETDAIAQFHLERDLRHSVALGTPKTNVVKTASSPISSCTKYTSDFPDLTEFVVHYQPLIHLKTGHIAGFEALVRWQHPVRGLVRPDQFIPIAEQTGLIIPIGEWVLHQACQQTYQWQQQFPQHASLIISVNLSGKQFGLVDLTKRVERVLTQTQLAPNRLKLEVTETVVMKDFKTAIDLLLELKSLDIKLSMDDFGTGYSSFEYLTRFPMDTLKIDKSFVGEMDHQAEKIAIVETIISLSHHLHMDVIAEGVETLEQLKLLHQLNCEYGQGYFFAKPLPANEAETLLKDASPSQFVLT